MADIVFLAGATGAVGTALIPFLKAAGYTIYGSTRTTEGAKKLENAGISPVVVDVFNASALSDALCKIRPQSVIHQLTDLPRGLDPAQMKQAVVNNARIRNEGTRNLVEAAKAAGSRRLVAQSIAWAYRAGAKPYLETSPLDMEAPEPRSVSVNGVVALERWVLTVPELEGTVLRYGQIYGPGTGADTPAGASPLHVEAAAAAALLALQRSHGGTYNIAEDQAEVSSEKAKRELGWSPSMRQADGA
ncbi:NAD(P)-dependent oxidoreductase [Caballeronia sp. LZ043]|uniref:NAD-dependent epimerase/dehydratase family protein n=1 Tax=Caballeronia sp. LZ043 TaxID=3038569 RepID=UPI00285D62EC|nr:NAD(P)-dependent oxidoreductase [Caballeronia sp. LZ043]MDR5823619.1 NAD(P)-dependent oxidoreductase [Caballeronia sp. LZ043]